ncbi:MAG: hypothetical protein JWP63_6419 [Candidatus Solibacter sp.]|nr:hypothetical protein [Candidatus Solibacter sp.]
MSVRTEYESRLPELESGWARVRGEHATAFSIAALLGAAILLLIPYAVGST